MSLLTMIFIFSSNSIGCSIIKITKNGITVVGNNEDQMNPNTRIWFEPGKKGIYGVVYVGFDNLYPQGAMNEVGLFFDACTQSFRPVLNTNGKLKISALELEKKIMQECITVNEVKDLISRYNIDFWASAVLRFVDKTGKYLYVDGDSLIIGEKDYFVQTNVRPYENKKCWRFEKATRLLQNSYNADINYCKSIMDSIHQEKKSGGTIYTTIYDLNSGKVYLYYFYNYNNVITFDLKEELKKGHRVLNMSDLFPNNAVGQKYYTEYNKILAKIKQFGDSLTTDINADIKVVKNEITNSFIDSYPFYYKISKNAEYYLNEKIDYRRAILFLRLNVEIYPDYWSAYNDLANAYFKDKQYPLALNNYLRSVELNPDNVLGKNQIEILNELIKK